MRELDPEDIDQLITVSGMVIRTSGIIPEMRQALFECVVCGHVETVEVDRGRIAEPTVCSRCSTNHCLALIHNRSLFDDKQIVKMQVHPGSILVIEGQSCFFNLSVFRSPLMTCLQVKLRELSSCTRTRISLTWCSPETEFWLLEFTGQLRCE